MPKNKGESSRGPSPRWRRALRQAAQLTGDKHADAAMDRKGITMGEDRDGISRQPMSKSEELKGNPRHRRGL